MRPVLCGCSDFRLGGFSVFGGGFSGCFTRTGAPIAEWLDHWSCLSGRTRMDGATVNEWGVEEGTDVLG